MKRVNNSGFILMIVVMIAILGFVVFFAVKRIADAHGAAAQAALHSSQLK